MHFVWNFLWPVDRCMLGYVHPGFHSYAALRASAMSADIPKLLQPRPPPSDRPISQVRVHAEASLLLRFDFNYGDFIRHKEGPSLTPIEIGNRPSWLWLQLLRRSHPRVTQQWIMIVQSG